MVQHVTANDILDALNARGCIALDIRFDTGKATIKDESRAVIDQIAATLRDNADLKVSVEGHTNSTGTPEGTRRSPQHGPRRLWRRSASLGLRLTVSLQQAGAKRNPRPTTVNRTEERPRTAASKSSRSRQGVGEEGHRAGMDVDDPWGDRPLAPALPLIFAAAVGKARSEVAAGL